MSDYPVPDANDIDLLQVLRALGDPIRLDIVTALADGRPRRKKTEGWGEGVTKSTMSHHLRVLREAGLTRTLVDGREHAIQLRRAELDERFPGLIDALTRTNAGTVGEAAQPAGGSHLTSALFGEATEATDPDPAR